MLQRYKNPQNLWLFSSLCLGILLVPSLVYFGVFIDKQPAIFEPNLAESRKLPNKFAVENGTSYFLSLDILCSACSVVPDQINSLLNDAQARPVIRHMLRSPQAISFALLYESILRHSPEKALPFLTWAVSQPFEIRLKPDFGHEWLLKHLTLDEQQAVATLINHPEIQAILTADIGWFTKIKVFETPTLFVNEIPFKPTADSTISYGHQARQAEKTTRVSK